MIPPIELPSDPSREIALRKPRLADQLDFSDVSIFREEAITTLYLNRIQTEETFYDSKLWTGDDRRMVLYWQWLHLNKKDTTIGMSYPCHCGISHTAVVDLKKIGTNYTSITGKPERKTTFKGKDIIVRPLRGAHLEELELIRMPIAEYGAELSEMSQILTRIAKEYGVASSEYQMQDEKIRLFTKRHGPTSSAYRKIQDQLTALEVAFCIDLPEDDKLASDVRRQKKQKLLETLDYDEFDELRELVRGKLGDMRHGLESEIWLGKIYLITPPLDCPAGNDTQKEAGGTQDTKLRLPFPFRSLDHIPILQTRALQYPY